jgi:iron complex outermembrane receptor protein
LTNPFFNYTVKGDNFLRGTKIPFAINNLLDQHSIVGVVPFSTKSNAPAAGDQLTLLPARAISITMTFGYAPARERHLNKAPQLIRE